MLKNFKQFNEGKVPRDFDVDLDVRFGDELSDGSIIVAHSTSSALLPDIMKNGLEIDSNAAWDNTTGGKLYFEVEPTSTHYGSNVYAWKATQTFGGSPITLYVKVNKDDLHTDMDDFDLGPRYRENQKEYYDDVPPEDILGLRYFSVDVKPEDFEEFLKIID